MADHEKDEIYIELRSVIKSQEELIRTMRNNTLYERGVQNESLVDNSMDRAELQTSENKRQAASLAQKDDVIAGLTKALTEAKAEIIELEHQLIAAQAQTTSYDETNSASLKTISHLRDMVNRLEDQVASLRAEVRSKAQDADVAVARAEALESTQVAADKAISEAVDRANQNHENALNLEKVIRNKDLEIARLKASLKEKGLIIEATNRKVGQLEEELKAVVDKTCLADTVKHQMMELVEHSVEVQKICDIAVKENRLWRSEAKTQGWKFELK